MQENTFWISVRKYVYLYGPGLLKKIIDFIIYILKIFKNGIVDGIKEIFGGE